MAALRVRPANLLHSSPPASKNMQQQTPKATQLQQQHAKQYYGKTGNWWRKRKKRWKGATNLLQIVPLNENERFL